MLFFFHVLNDVIISTDFIDRELFNTLKVQRMKMFFYVCKIKNSQNRKTVSNLVCI